MPAWLVRARPVADGELDLAEPLLERLDLASAALATLGHLASVDEDALRRDDGWAARVEVDGTALLVIAEGDRWTICAPPGGDDAEAMLAARRLHGLLGEQAEGWDLDR